MDLTNIYNQIKNPIDDDYVMRKLLEAYSKSGVFYSNLVKTNIEESDGKYYVKDADEFYSMMFNDWKNNICSMTKEEYIELRKKGYYADDFVVLRNFLLSIDDVSTEKEANQIAYNNYEDKTLEKAFDKYFWRSLGMESGWHHVSSRYVNPKDKRGFPIEHRLYLNTGSTDTLKVTKLLVEKYKENGIPYYFKFDRRSSRDDSIVIYSSTELLEKNINILEEIKEENKELVSRFGRPPILTGIIDDFFGYGSEPPRTPNGETQSFNEVRSDMIEDIINKKEREWIRKKIDSKVVNGAKTMTFDDYIARLGTLDLLDRLKERYENRYDSIEEFRNRKGYGEEELESKDFQYNIYSRLLECSRENLIKFCDGTLDKMENIDFYNNGKKITYYGAREFKSLMDKFIKKIIDNDPKFIEEIREEIKREAPLVGIDPNKFCFDTLARERLKMVEPTRIVEKPKKEKEVVNLEKVDVQSIINVINPTLLQGKCRLPNGREIPTVQYIQEFVFEHLPENGVVILSNNSILPVQQFIEEKVLFECQEKYNGDVAKYMSENTKKNPGRLILEEKDKTYDFPVETIMYAINPEILKGYISLPNGKTISIYDYVEKLYTPHIPYNGVVTSNSGNNIPVKQYIEEVLIPCITNMQNNDINHILSETTRNNNGIIDMSYNNFKMVQDKIIQESNARNRQNK